MAVIYDPEKQRDLVRRLVRAGIQDLQHFMKTVSTRSEDLMAIRDRVTFEIMLRLHCFKTFMKDHKYRSEKEMRFTFTSDSKLVPEDEIKYFQRGNDSIPYLFFDLRSPITKRLSLKEIKIGPNASYPKELGFVEELLDRLGYGRDAYRDRPRIVHSSLAD